MMSLGRVVSLGLVVAGLVSSGCGDPATELVGHRKRGEAYLAEGQNAEAIIEFRNMLRMDPNDASAHWGLARALLAAKQPRKAYWEIQETVRLDPANQEAQLRLGEFLLFGKSEELERAVEAADAVLAAEPERSEAWVLKAQALEALKLPEDAEAAYAQAVEVASDDRKPLLLYGRFLLRQGRVEDAEPLYRRLPEVKPDFTSYAALASFLAAVGDRDEESEAFYREALETAEPSERRVAYTLLANFLLSRGRAEEAEATMKSGIEAVDDPLPLIYALARYYHAQGAPGRAEAMIQEATRERPEDPEPLLLLSTYRGQTGDVAGALEAAERALAVQPENVVARLRKAEALLDLGRMEADSARVAEGRAVVEAVLAREEGNPEALFVRAKIDIAEGRIEDALGALRKVVDTRPYWAQAHLVLASALFLEGDARAARSEVARALELDANLDAARKLMARIHASLGDHDLAIEQARRILERDPGDSETRLLVAQSLVYQRRFEAALEELEAIDREDRDSQVLYALGRVHLLRGERARAREYLLAALEQDPTRYDILRALLQLDVADGRLDESSERIENALRARPDDPRFTQLQGEVALYSGRTVEAEGSFRRAIELDPNDLRAYQNLARYLAVSGRPSEVLDTYERALENNSTNATLHLIVGSLYELNGRLEAATERYEEAVRLEPELAVAKNNLAYLLAERGGNLDRALDLAQEAKARLPNSAYVADTLGWVLYKKKVPSAAIGYLREAEGAIPPEDPQIGIVRHHLALAYEANGEPERAREVLDRAIRELNAQFGGEGEDRPPEPPWAAELRSMHARLAASS